MMEGGSVDLRVWLVCEGEYKLILVKLDGKVMKFGVMLKVVFLHLNFVDNILITNDVILNL